MDHQKTLALNGHTYIINRVDPVDGTWLVYRIMAGPFSLQREDFKEAQAILLSVVHRVEAGGASLPIYVYGRGFVGPDLKNELATVLKLTHASLQFNIITPFFADPELQKAMRGGLQDFISSITPPSPDISTAQ